MTSLRIAAITTDRHVDSLVARVMDAAREFELAGVARSWDDLGDEHDILLLDLKTPDALPRIRESRARGIRVIALSETPGEVTPAMAAGADAAPRTTDRTRDLVGHLRMSAARLRLVHERP